MATPRVDRRKDWDRRPGESEEHFKLFQVYLESRDRFGRRSSAIVARAHSRDRTYMRKLAARHDWRRRALEYDRWYNAQVSLETRRAIRRLGRENARLIHAGYRVSAELIKRFEAMIAMPLVDETGEEEVIDPTTGEPLRFADGSPVHRVVHVHPARWNLGTALKYAEKAIEIRQDIMLMTYDLKAGMTDERARDAAADDPEFAEHMRRSEAEFRISRDRDKYSFDITEN